MDQPRKRPSRRVQLVAVMRKEVGQTTRDKRVMMMLIVAPLIQLVIFGYAVSFEVDRVPTVIADLDRTAESRRFLRGLLADKTLLHAGDVADAAAADRALEVGGASAAVVVPAGFGKKVAGGEPAQVQVVIDGSDPNRSTVAAAAAARYFAEEGILLAFEALKRKGIAVPAIAGLTVSPRLFYNPTLATSPYMVPGVMAMLLVLVTTIATAMGLAREREMGTLEQVLVTPVSPVVLLVGKLLPFVVIGLFDVLLALTAAAWVFALPVRGDLLPLGVSTLAYVMSTLGVGLFISTVSRTQQQAFMGGFMFIMPAILLSGVVTPVRGMPWWLQVVTWLNPVRYFIEILRGVLLKGAGFPELWPRMVALFCFGLAILSISVWRLRKRVA